MTQRPKVNRQVIDGHSHIGEMAAWQLYDLKERIFHQNFEDLYGHKW